jgi:hypothetical protein
MKILSYRTTVRRPWAMWNRYPSGIIGLAFHVLPGRVVSIVWRRAS